VPEGPAAKTLGLERWVQAAFMGLALFLLWLLEKVVTLVWSTFAEPDPNVVMVVSIVVGCGTAFALYRNPNIYRVSYDIVGELTKVTWPSRRETQASTIVVVIASVIAAVIIGAFDAVWSAITDLIY
jgi:preprotein translocase subunit SecE